MGWTAPLGNIHPQNGTTATDISGAAVQPRGPPPPTGPIRTDISGAVVPFYTWTAHCGAAYSFRSEARCEPDSSWYVPV